MGGGWVGGFAGGFVECVGGLLKMGNQQTQEVEASSLGFEELVKEKSSFEQVLFLGENFLGERLDQRIPPSLENFDGGSIFIECSGGHGFRPP
jgi:hypothetical protein